MATDGAAKIGGKESGITSNTAGNDGGGLHCTGGGTTVRNLTIDGNTSTNTGGGIYLNIISAYKPTNPSNVLSNLTIKNNKTTGQYGGGIWCGSDNAILDACVVEGNTASLWGGGVYLVTNATDPGITLAGSLIIRNNTAAKNPDLSLASTAVGDLVFLLKRPAEVRLGLPLSPMTTDG